MKDRIFSPIRALEALGNLIRTGLIEARRIASLVDTIVRLLGKSSAESLESVIPMNAADDDSIAYVAARNQPRRAAAKQNRF
jgi:hypothetical protein